MVEQNLFGFKVVVSPLLKPEPKIKCGPIPYAEDVVSAFNQWLGDRFGWVDSYFVIGRTVYVPEGRKDEFFGAIKGVLHESRS